MTPNSVAAQQKLHVKRWIKKVNSAYFSKETLIILRTPVKIKQVMEMDGNGLLQFFFFATLCWKDVQRCVFVASLLSLLAGPDQPKVALHAVLLCSKSTDLPGP